MPGGKDGCEEGDEEEAWEEEEKSPQKHRNARQKSDVQFVRTTTGIEELECRE